MKYDVLTVGNAIIDVILSLPDKTEFVHLNKAEKKLNIDVGQKISVASSGIFPGGNACNVAVGLRRAGLKTALAASVAQDDFANHITSMLIREDIGQEFLLKSHKATVLNVALNYQEERTLFTHHQDQDHVFNFEQARVKAIYLTSLGHEWKSTYRTVARYVQQEGIFLAFNPGSTQLHDGVDSFSFILPLTNILFVNRDEAEILTGQKGSIQHLLKALQVKGPKVVSITCGALGSYAIDHRGTIYQMDAVTCPVVERTGAGDGYASGFLAAYLHGYDIEHSMRWGVHNSASVIGHSGAQAGLLTRKELEERV